MARQHRVQPVHAVGLMHAIHNARVQLLATASNNLGVAGIVAGLVAPFANGSLGVAVCQRLAWWHLPRWRMVGVRRRVARSSAIAARETEMSLETYWLVVPSIGTVVGLAVCLALWLTRPARHPHHHAGE